MSTRYAVVLISLLGVSGLQAQSYCSPTFLNGCFSWRNQAIDIGDISWTESDCNISDFTTLTTTENAGASVPMSVVNANWCGCSVWLDVNDDGDFDDANENLYHAYADMEISSYDFNITVPASAAAGSYRLRVIASWGSDGFTPGGNGNGGCGDFQYGNFTDLTLVVAGSSSVNEVEGSSLVALAGPNPTDGPVLLNTKGTTVLDRILVRSMDGRTVQDAPVAVRNGQVEVDLADVPAGAYLLECRAGTSVSNLRVVKR